MVAPLKPVKARDDQILVDRLYTVQQAAEILGFKTGKWVYDQIHAGNIEYVDLNASGQKEKYRIKASTINQLTEMYTFNRQGVRGL